MALADIFSKIIPEGKPDTKADNYQQYYELELRRKMVYGEFANEYPTLVVAGSYSQFRDFRRNAEAKDYIYFNGPDKIQMRDVNKTHIVFTGTAYNSPAFDLAYEMLERQLYTHDAFMKDMHRIGVLWEDALTKAQSMVK